MSLIDRYFSLDNRAYVVTGGAGLLGKQHAIAIAEAGGVPVVLDNSEVGIQEVRAEFSKLGLPTIAKVCNVLDPIQLNNILKEILGLGYHVGGLVNNLDYNPKMRPSSEPSLAGFESFAEFEWHRAIDLGLKSAVLCSQIFGGHMAQNGGGVIVNIASDLGIIAPDQRIYQDPEVSPEDWAIKPVTYSVTKFGLIGLTKYLASYWAGKSIRVNALAFGSVAGTQSAHLTRELQSRIPLGRLAQPDEYRGALIFHLSDASSYMTGAVTVLDGGRSIW